MGDPLYPWDRKQESQQDEREAFEAWIDARRDLLISMARSVYRSKGETE